MNKEENSTPPGDRMLGAHSRALRVAYNGVNAAASLLTAPAERVYPIAMQNARAAQETPSPAISQ